MGVTNKKYRCAKLNEPCVMAARGAIIRQSTLCQVVMFQLTFGQVTSCPKASYMKETTFVRQYIEGALFMGHLLFGS